MSDIEIREAEIRGATAALRWYAVWHNGVQYVGCGWITLKQAIEKVERLGINSLYL